jgi:hypothetical protein
MAMIEGSWTVTGDHVDMAKEILFDLYQNLIQWLESEVKVGSGGSEKKKMEGHWKDAYNRCERFDFDDHRGVNWVKKAEMYKVFGNLANLSSKGSVNGKYNDYGAKMFKETREGVSKYVKLRDDYISKSKQDGGKK